jgi:flagellar hook-length control protein FliK
MKDSALSSKDISAANLKGTPFAEHVDEIISKSKMTVRDGQNGTLAFRLNPDNLGSVNISLGLENGVLSAKFLVDSAEAKENLTANMNALKESLAQEGINIGQFQVDVRAGYSGQSRDSEDTDDGLNRSKISKSEKVSQEYDTVSTTSHNGVIDMKI